MNKRKKLQKDIVESMKNKDRFRLTTLREIKGAMDLEHINKQVPLTDELLIDTVSKQIKMRNESLKEFVKASRADLVEKTEKELEIFKETKKWLDIYFSGKVPEFTPKYKINNITDFRKEVIDIMNLIQFGETITYNDIAETIAKKRRIKKMSAQAVGGAVGSNPICIIIPCHRVVGKNGKLTGYGGGIKNKEILLEHEQNNKM